jgi:hypothetical protein
MVLPLVLIFEPMQAPGAVVTLVFVSRVDEAIEAGDENPMLYVEEEVDGILCKALSSNLTLERDNE